MKLALVFLLGALAGVVASVRYDGRGEGFGDYAYDYFTFRWRGLRIQVDVGDGERA